MIFNQDEEEFKKEFEKEIDGKVEEIVEHDIGWDIEQYLVKTSEHDYIVMKNEEEAEELAIAQVTQDLEDQPELFNQDWLNCLKGHRLTGQSFIEYASEDAISVDGWAHFLSHYDGYYETTKNGYVYWRDA